jgi:beta-N-acetylhexosaminidase
MTTYSKKYLLLFILLFFCLASFGKSSLTLNQKIGQMIIIGFDGTNIKNSKHIVKDIEKQRIGGVILFDEDLPHHTAIKNIVNPLQLKKLNSSLQKRAKHAALKAGNDLYPLFIGVDYEGGKINRLKHKYGFPKTVSQQYLGKHNLAITKKYANRMAMTLHNAGINLNFAPLVDLAINPNNPVIAKLRRSFGKNADIVTKRAGIFSKTYAKNSIACTLKHFPGHGSSKGDTHLGFVDITNQWQPQELLPYERLIDKHQACPLVMTAHLVNRKLDHSGRPASLSYAITTKLLRNKLHFRGLIITDDLQMKAISQNYSLTKTVELAINSGADILLFGNQLKYQPNIAKKVIEIVDKLIKQGKIEPQTINRAYKKIINLKIALRNHELSSFSP